MPTVRALKSAHFIVNSLTRHGRVLLKATCSVSNNLAVDETLSPTLIGCSRFKTFIGQYHVISVRDWEGDIVHCDPHFGSLSCQDINVYWYVWLARSVGEPAPLPPAAGSVHDVEGENEGKEDRKADPLLGDSFPLSRRFSRSEGVRLMTASTRGVTLDRAYNRQAEAVLRTRTPTSSALIERISILVLGGGGGNSSACWGPRWLSDAAGRRVSSWIFLFLPSVHSGIASLSPRFTRVGSQDLAVKSCPKSLHLLTRRRVAVIVYSKVGYSRLAIHTYYPSNPCPSDLEVFLSFFSGLLVSNPSSPFSIRQHIFEQYVQPTATLECEQIRPISRDELLVAGKCKQQIICCNAQYLPDGKTGEQTIFQLPLITETEDLQDKSAELGRPARATKSMGSEFVVAFSGTIHPHSSWCQTAEGTPAPAPRSSENGRGTATLSFLTADGATVPSRLPAFEVRAESCAITTSIGLSVNCSRYILGPPRETGPSLNSACRASVDVSSFGKGASPNTHGRGIIPTNTDCTCTCFVHPAKDDSGNMQ
ncbi:hypothetical protein PR048_003039 [Dryococelus australis]|uniref:Uncharacterized protein n=1 Tax=Dryococelus australis TaxID=614101 RepID=A0ABQ9IM24_9NEOP|nr:hypothetical protein PR048_003039 [Dryococelus australis]